MGEDFLKEQSPAIASATNDAEQVAKSTAATARERKREDGRNGKIFAFREILDRIGYGAVTPQFINILLWLSASAHPYIIFLIGILNGLKTVVGVVLSNLLQEYHRMHTVSKSTIGYGGVIFGFSFLFMAFGLLLKNLWVFSIAFIVGAIGIVSYGDLYKQLMHELLRRERMGPFLRSIAHWGILITAITLILSGFLLDYYPMSGVPITFSLLGQSYTLNAYGYLFSFEITALAFIISGYATNLLVDRREKREYRFMRFCKEYARIIRGHMSVFQERPVLLLTIASVIAGLLQILITAYSGIAIYQIFERQYAWPFLALAIVYAIAVIGSFTGPFFTQKLHRSLGLAPMMVFGTLLMAILPLVLVYNQNIAAITAALVTYVIGGAILGFAQGLLAQRIMDPEKRRSYFQAQSYVVILPYVLAIPALSWIANQYPFAITFLIVAVGMIAIVMPIYFYLVVLGSRA